MNKLFSIIFIFYSITAFAQNKSLDFKEIEFYKEKAKKNVIELYDAINLLSGVELTMDDKIFIINPIVEDLFFSENIVLYNDLDPDLNKVNNKKVRDYLDELTVIFPNLNKDYGADFRINIKEITDIYYDHSQEFFVLKIHLTRETIVPENTKYSNKKDLDFYFKFKLNNKTIKIYSMQKHSNSPFSNAVKVIPVNKREIKTDENDKVISHHKKEDEALPNEINYTFNIHPNDANLKIDGEDFYYINDIPVVVPYGKSEIEISAKGFQTKKMIYDFTEDDGNIEIKLMEVFGTLTVKTPNNNAKKDNAWGANIVIDGKNVGKIPSSRIPLKPGIHLVYFEKSGYVNKKKKIFIEEFKDTGETVKMADQEKLRKTGNFFKNILLGPTSEQSDDNNVNNKSYTTNNSISSNNHLSGLNMNPPKVDASYERSTNGDAYSGQKDVNGRRNGNGTLVKRNGSWYRGTFQNGTFWNGTADELATNGDKYKGQYQNGRRDGKGELTKRNGSTYKGTFQSGTFWNGTVDELATNGDKYKGQYQNGRRHGNGELTKRNGSTYKGTFQGGTFWNGSANIIERDGSTSRKTYSNGRAIN